MTGLGDLLRHARRAAGVSQRDLAAAAGLGAVVVAKAEAGNRPDTVSRLLAAAGFGLQLVPLVPPDEQETAAAREWLCRHPLDRLAAVVLRQPEVLGLPTREGARLLVGLLERAPVLLLGDVAHRLWVPPRPTDPPLTRVEGLVLGPTATTRTSSTTRTSAGTTIFLAPALRRTSSPPPWPSTCSVAVGCWPLAT